MIQSPSEFGDYAYAYRSAARRLAAEATSDDESEIQLALPTIYLYRHALELALKDAIVWTEITISQTSHTGGQSVDEVRRDLQGHKLWPLLDKLLDRYPLIEEPNSPLGLRGAVAPAVTAADGLDADGQRLRYPYVSRGGERSWTDARRAPTRTRVVEISRTMEAALEYLLEGLGFWFETALDHGIEQAWIAQLWEAERRALRVESLHPPVGGYQHGDMAIRGDPEVADELKAELSADLLFIETDRD